MALEQKLSLKLAQKLVMTPSLQQAIKLLQMTRLELEGVLTQELVENPILEESNELTSAEEELKQEKEKEEEDFENLNEIDIEAFFGEAENWESSGKSSLFEEREGAPLENTLTREPDLYDQLMWQLQMLDLDEETREICEGIIGNLNPEGFLTATIEELQAMGVPPPELLDGSVENDLEAYMTAVDEHESEAADEPDLAAELVAPELSPEAESGLAADRLALDRALDDSPLYTVPREAGGSNWLEAAPGHESPVILEARPAVVQEASVSAEAEAPTFEAPTFEAPTAGVPTAEEFTAEEFTAEESAAEESPEEDLGPVGGYRREAVEKALEIVRGLDPPGVACHTLRESLLRQLDIQGYDYRDLVYQVIDQAWDLFKFRKFEAVAKKLGVPLAELEYVVELVRGLDTRPGRQYSVNDTQYVEPDVHVVKVGDKYVVQLNEDGLPRLRVSRAYRKMLQALRHEGKQNEAQQYIKDKMRSALWLIKSLDQRQRTIFKVATSIVRQQRAFLDYGIDHLRPMVLRDVAEDIEMHESTVSRVVSNKYVHTPRGLYPLKFFFHSGIDREYGGDISSLTVKRKIQQMIQDEDAHKPLSDSELMRTLKREGIQIARRTVAKYRDELGIPSSTERKQIF